MGKKYFSGLIKGIFRFLNRLRLFIINIIFWGIILSALFLMFKGDLTPDINQNTVLKISLNRQIVEQYSGGYQSEIESLASGRGEILLRDLKTAIDYAASDDRIASIFLDLSGFTGGSLAKLQEITNSLDKFKKSGKKIISYSDNYSSSSYYLASRADRIVLDPFGEVRLRGFSSYRNYFKKGLDKFDIKMNVFKAGDYKSAVEPYLQEEMSDNAREAISVFFNRMINITAGEIAEARDKSKDEIFDYIKNYHEYLKKTEGDSAAAALVNGFADSLGDYYTALDMIDETEEIEWTEYLKAALKDSAVSDNKIAVVTASGMILDGDFGPGKIGSDTFNKLLRSAADDPDVKAVVLRVDSGGGSASASEIIRRAVLHLRERGKPVVVSMSSAAASGGYWISADADRIISYPSTVTGSIGVFAVLPDFSGFLEKYPGITIDGFSSPDFPAQYRPDMNLDIREKEIISLGIENTYKQFIGITSKGRGMTYAAVKRIAGGRIWSGLDAVENGLVDSIGYFDDAVRSAAELAELSDYSLVYLDPEEDWKIQAVRELAGLVRKIKASSLESFFISASELNNLFFPERDDFFIFAPGSIYSWTWMDKGFCF